MSREISGRTVLLWLVPFFGVILIANAWFVTLSMRTFHGEDRQRPYQQGLEYNETLAARAQQQAAGWKAALEARNGAAGLTLRLTLTKADGAPLDGLKLSGVLRHPADTFRDIPFALKQVGPGRYEAAIRDAGRGRRDAVIRSDGGVPFETERRIWLP
jgi:nitrogen fixation protein FixH